MEKERGTSAFRHPFEFLEGPKKEKKQGQKPARSKWRYNTTERGYSCKNKGLHKLATFPDILLLPIPLSILCALIPHDR